MKNFSLGRFPETKLSLVLLSKLIYQTHLTENHTGRETFKQNGTTKSQYQRQHFVTSFFSRCFRITAIAMKSQKIFDRNKDYISLLGIAENCTYVPFKITKSDNGFCFVSLFSLTVVSLFVFVYFIIDTIVMSYSSFPLLSILVFWCKGYQRCFQNHVKIKKLLNSPHPLENNFFVFLVLEITFH